jgi:NAD(P)H-hydrate epimerase
VTSARVSFATPEGASVPAVSTAEMHEVLRIATQHTGPGLLPIVENGGRCLALAALDLVRGAAARALVFVGSGVHGAIGVCAARHLANRGVTVQVVTLTRPALSDGALGQQFLALAETPASVTHWDEAFVATDADVIIDAVLEQVPDGPVRGAEMALVRAANHAAEAGVPVLALDVPSGLDPDTGSAPGDVVQATCTLALGLPRRGLSEECGGELWLADLGIPPGVYARAGIVVSPWFGAADRVRLTSVD